MRLVAHGDLSAGQHLVTAPRPQVRHHLLRDPVRRPAPFLRPQREIHIADELPHGQDPLDPLGADDEIGHLRDDLQVFHVAQVQRDDVPVEPGVADGLLEHAQVVSRDLRVLDLREQAEENPVVEVHAGVDVLRAHPAPEIARVGTDSVEKGCRHLTVHLHDSRIPQVLGQDGRRAPVIGPDVVILRQAGASPDGDVMIDDDVGNDGARQGVVPGPGLRVHEGYDAEVVEVDFREGTQVDLQVTDHGPVLGASHHPAGGDDGPHLPLRLQEILEGIRGGERVGVGVIVGHNQDFPLAPDDLVEPVETGLIVRAVLSHDVRVLPIRQRTGRPIRGFSAVERGSRTRRCPRSPFRHAEPLESPGHGPAGPGR